jgi:hypothetical protein
LRIPAPPVAIGDVVDGLGDVPVGDVEGERLEVSVKALEASELPAAELAAGGGLVGVSPGADVAGVETTVGGVLVPIGTELEPGTGLLSGGAGVLEDTTVPGGGETAELEWTVVTAVSVAVLVAVVVVPIVIDIEEVEPQTLTVTVTVEAASVTIISISEVGF